MTDAECGGIARMAMLTFTLKDAKEIKDFQAVKKAAEEAWIMFRAHCPVEAKAATWLYGAQKEMKEIEMTVPEESVPWKKGARALKRAEREAQKGCPSHD